jgi:hypothetical protein
VADALAITARRDAELADKARLVLDTLKAAADSPQAVADLFTLDRFMAQLRRGAAVRAVIAGQELPYPSTGPMSLSDAVRSACSEAAETAPIAIDLRDDPALEAGPAAALAHLMAEILDHEATFSEPGRPIEVTSRPGAEGVTLVVRQWGPPPSDQELAAINALLGGDQPPGGRPPQDAATFGLEVAGLLAGRIGAGVLASAAQAPNGQSSGTIVEIRLPVALLASRQRSVPDPPPPPIQARPAVTPAGSIPVFTPARNLERPAPPASPETSALVALDQEVDAPNPPARRTSAQTGLATFDPAPAGYDGVAGEYDPTAAQAELEPMVADSSPRPMPSYRPSLRAQVNGLVTEASAAVSGGDEPSVAQTPPDATATSNEPAPAAHEAPQFDLADTCQGASGPAGPAAPTPAPFPAAAPSQPAVESSQLAPAPSQPTAAPGAPAVPNPIGAPAPSGFRAPRAGGLPLFGAAPATSAPPAAPEPPPLGPTWTPQPAPTPQTAPDPNGFAGFAPRAIYETDARGQALAELSHLATRADGDAARPRSSSRNGGKLSPEAERLRQRLAQLAPPSAPTNPPEGTPQ